MFKHFILPFFIFLLVSSALYLRAVRYDTKLSSDQMFFRLVYQDQKGGGLGDYRVEKFDQYLPFQISNWLVDRLGSDLQAYQVLLGILSFAYLLAIYLVIFSITKHVGIAMVLAIGSLVPRMAFGSQFWGITETGHAIHRSFFQPFVPLIIYGYYLWFREPKKLILLFIGFGLVAAFYPTQAVYLAIILLGHFFLFRKGHLSQRFGYSILFGIAFAIGLLPLVARSFQIGIGSTAISSDIVHQFNEAIRYRFDYTFYPGSLVVAPRSIFFDLLPFVVVGIILWRIWPYLPEYYKKLIRFGNQFLILMLIVSFGLPIIQEFAIAITKSRIIVFDQFGTTKFFYLIGLLDMVIVVRYLLTDQVRKPARADRRIGIFLIVSLLISSYTMTRVLGSSIPILNQSIAVYNPEIAKLCQWAHSTDRLSKFLFPDFGFRYCADRRVVANFKEGMVWLYTHRPEEFITWSQRVKKQDELYQNGTCEGLASFGKEHGARYMVVPQRVACETNQPVFTTQSWFVYEI